MVDIEIRFASSADFSACKEFENITDEDLLRFKISRSDICLAEKTGTPVGYLRLDSLWSHISMIGLVIVKETCRKHGIGTALVDFICRDLTEKGERQIISSTMPDNLPSQQWHAAMGFEECGFLCGINTKEGVGEIFYKKPLNSEL